MNVEQMTNEELAGYLSSTMDGRAEFAIPVKIGAEGVEFKNYAYTHLAHEAARRLRNSIPKPRVEVVMTSGGKVPVLKVNGQTIMQSGDTVNDTLHRITKALGMEGGGDE